MILVAAMMSAIAGPEAIIKQRAKDLSNQNNARQGIVPAAPGQPAAPAAAPQPPPDPVVSKIQADLTALKLKSSAAQVQQLAKDLGAAIRTGKASDETLAKLAGDLSRALSGATMTAAEIFRLAQEINMALNPATLGDAQKEAVLGDIQTILQGGGAPRNQAAMVGSDLKIVAADAQMPPAK